MNKKRKVKEEKEKIIHKKKKNEKEFISSNYLHNFLLILTNVLKEYKYLFQENEIKLLELFQNNLNENEKKLYIRLFLRKKNLFRVSKLIEKYQEIQNIKDLCYQLEMKNFLKIVPEGDQNNIKEIIYLLTLKELKNIIKDIHLNKNIHLNKKIQLINIILQVFFSIHSLHIYIISIKVKRL